MSSTLLPALEKKINCFLLLADVSRSLVSTLSFRFLFCFWCLFASLRVWGCYFFHTGKSMANETLYENKTMKINKLITSFI